MEERIIKLYSKINCGLMPFISAASIRQKTGHSNQHGLVHFLDFEENEYILCDLCYHQNSSVRRLSVN